MGARMNLTNLRRIALRFVLVSLVGTGCASIPLQQTTVTSVKLVGKSNKPSLADVDYWLLSVIDFWSKHYPRSSVERCLKNWRFIFTDDEKVCQVGVCGKALTYQYQAASIIGSTNPRALVGHEAGHAVLACHGWPEWKQHEEMNRVEYPHR